MSKTGKRLDWDEVKRKLAESQRSLDRALATTDDDGLEAVYRERAAQLAERQTQSAAVNQGLRVLVFGLGTERYAVEFADLVELLPFVNCTPLPGGPSALLGVINVHGELRSVVDLGRLLDLPDRSVQEGGYVLLLQRRGRRLALRVDRLDGIQYVHLDQLAAPPGPEAGAPLPYMRGLTPDRLRLLDTQALGEHAMFKRQ